MKRILTNSAAIVPWSINTRNMDVLEREHSDLGNIATREHRDDPTVAVQPCAAFFTDNQQLIAGLTSATVTLTTKISAVDMNKCSQMYTVKQNKKQYIIPRVS